MYAAAFADNPAYRFIFSGSAAKPAPPGALQWLFERRACLLLWRKCPVLVVCAAPSPGATAPGKVLAAGALVPSARKHSTLDMVRAGILTWPLFWGMASLRRVLRMSDTPAELMGPGAPLAGLALGGELVLMAVHPECQVSLGGEEGGLLAALVCCCCLVHTCAALCSRFAQLGIGPVLACTCGRLTSRLCGIGLVALWQTFTSRPPCRGAVQGQGLGKRVLAALLRLWDGEFGAGGGLVVATQDAVALHLYKKAGFQPVILQGKEEEQQHAEGGFGNWFLHRPA